MTSNDNDAIVDAENNHSEVKTDQYYTYVSISEFGMENTLYPYSPN